MMRLGWVAALCMSAAAAQAEMRLTFDEVAGQSGWPAFDADQVQCFFPQGEVRAAQVETRFGETIADAFEIDVAGERVLTVESSLRGNREGVFSIWTENPQVEGPNGWRVGVTRLGEVQRASNVCVRGYHEASNWVICSYSEAGGAPMSFYFKELTAPVDLAASGALSDAWLDAKLSRMDRYAGPAVGQGCGFSGS